MSAGPASRAATLAAGLVAVLVLAGAGYLVLGDRFADRPAPPGPTRSGSPSPSPTQDVAAQRSAAVEALLAERAAAVLAGDTAPWAAHVDPAHPQFAEQQRLLAHRLLDVPFEEWAYQVVGDGPGLAAERAAGLPAGSAIVRVRLTYRIEGTATRTDREQYLTVVPRGGRWLLAGDTDADASGFETQRDLWDLGPVRVVRGGRATVVGDPRGASRAAMARLAREADGAVRAVNQVWRAPWPKRPVLVLPRSQADMARLLGDGDEASDGLAQIAAVTTGAFEDGLARGDRVVVNPDAFGTLGPLGRTVVLTHEMTHVATRASSVVGPPIWLSEGFADYVAYEATPVPIAIVASDVIDQVRAGKGPRRLPDAGDFDAGEGDIAAAYEGAWLACRLIAQRFGEKELVRFYAAMSDSAGTGWPDEMREVLGLTEKELTRAWRDYLRELAG